MRLEISTNIKPSALKIARIMVHLGLISPQDAIKVLKNGSQSEHKERARAADC